MSKYYRSQRTRNIYDPHGKDPFKLSRSKLDLFLNCLRCFYLDRRLGVGQPPGFPFNLNSAVDSLLKNEFDFYRQKGQQHPLLAKHKIDAIPFSHERLDEWRDSLRRGIQYHDKTSNLIITGGIDDLWINSKEEIIIVDYKATSKKDAVSLDADWQIGYKRQMSLYTWLFKKNGFKVADTGYFVYCNGIASKPMFDQKLEFDISLLPYKIDDAWVESAIHGAYACLKCDEIPAHSEECDHCQYILAVVSVSNKLG